MVNAQPFTMGGIVDYGVSIGTRSSSLTEAIKKVLEELRQNRDVREERLRELEFLEKGGNPLDFKFAHVATASVPFTSLTNQIAEQNVISEAKGNFVASPRCKSDILEGKIVKRGTKRLNAAQPKQSLSTGSNNTARKTEDSGLSRLVVKSQAYVRRNRSKPNRESANVFSIRSSVTLAKGSDPRDEKGVAHREKADEPAASVKPTGSYSDSEQKTTASDHQVTLELDGFRNIRESDYVVKNESKHEEVASAETHGANLKSRYCDSSASTRDERESSAGDEKADDSRLDNVVGHIHVGELDKRRVVASCAIEDSGIHKNTVDPLCEDSRIIIDDHVASNISLASTVVDSKSHEDLDNSRHSNKIPKESGQTEWLIGLTSVKVNRDPVKPESSNISFVNDVMEACESAIVAQKDTGCPSYGHNMNIEEVSDRNNDSCLRDPISTCPTAVGTDVHKIVVPDAIHSLKSDEPNMENEIKKSENLDKMAKKEYEDSILLNAGTIKASIKRASERLHCNISLEKRRKSHWDFVLEEMAWMANDFMQERLWKSMAAAQMCHWIASDARAKFEEASIQIKQKIITKSLTKGIMSFWHSVEASRTARRTTMMQEHNSTMLEKTNASGIEAGKEHGIKSLGTKESLQPRQLPIQDYAVRFLEYNYRTADAPVLAEAPSTPDRLNDFWILKVSDQLSEESLVYTVPIGAMLAYRESIESLFEHHKRSGNTELMDEYDASVCDSAADFPREDTHEGDEGETCTSLSAEAYESGFISKMCHKKKHQMHQRISGVRQYDIGIDVPYEPCFKKKSGNRPFHAFPGAFPATRSRTAARQRVVSPFHAGASSGDTNSLQDVERSLHGGSLQLRNMDYESTVDFDGQLPYDAAEVSTKANKKKKLNNPGYKTAQNTANSRAPPSVKDYLYLKKRPESHQYDFNGISVTNGVRHASNKLKIMKQGIDNSPAASRVASQMSNMANPARFVKIIADRERGRKCKALKLTSSDGWSNFEDQALVVLVHDMGQNWELISDAINSIVKFKSVHRKPNECKEHHKVLVDRSSGDGADSAEDSGSSQRNRNQLPGIPKGSARQLFERLQGPFEEENLKEHFEKIMLLMQQVHPRHRQGNNQEVKPVMRPHSSHDVALSHTCVNKLPGGILMPLDLCDSVSPNLDSITPGSLSLGSHTNGLTLTNYQGSSGPATPTSNLSSRLPDAPGIVLGSNLPSSSTWNTQRDTQKYGIPRLTSLQGDEQPQIQYNQVVSGRNFQQPGGSVPGVFPTGIDHSGHAMRGAQIAGLNRGMSAAKAVSPRISAPGGLEVSSGNLMPNSGQGVPSPASFHPGGISGPANSISRPHDPLQTLHVPQGSSHNSHVNCVNASFSNVAASPPSQQPQQLHPMSQSSCIFGNSDHSQIRETSASPQQQADILPLPKQRQTQQHMVPQQNNDISGASAVSCVQSGSHIVQQNQGSVVNPIPCSQPQPQYQLEQEPQNPPDASSSPNLPASATLQKQKKQGGQRQSRQNLQQRNQGSQQAKLMNSLGRGNMVTPQTPPVDNMPANAVSTPSKKHVPDKRLIQNGQGFSPVNTALTPSTLQPMNQPTLYTMSPQLLKQLPDIGNQSRMQASASQTISDSQPSPIYSKLTMTTEQQQQQVIPLQGGIQRTIMQQNFQMSSECRTDTHHKQVQHNQMVQATSVPLSTDSGSLLLSSVNQLKCEAHNPTSVTLSSNLLSSPRNTSFGNDPFLPSSEQDVLQRKISGGFPMHSQVVDQWNQQASQQLQSQGSANAPTNFGSS